jgi:GDP-L-fucose synthase
MNKTDKIYIAGHRGMVGSAIVRKLQAEGYTNIITRGSKELDLKEQSAVRDFFAQEKPYVVVHSSHESGVKKLLFLGSSCIYPKMAPQPLKEESLLTGLLEQTNEPYAIAKIAGIKLAESYRRQYGCNYISAMPTNLYGPNDNYDLNNSHVLPALIRKFHTAKVSGAPSVEVWGTGSPMREFLHVDDLADACFFLLQNYNEELFVNIGTGVDLTIKELAEMIKDIVGYSGELKWNTEKPDGTPRKLMDVSRLHNLGWKHRIGLREGITSVYAEFAKSEMAKA